MVNKKIDMVGILFSMVLVFGAIISIVVSGSLDTNLTINENIENTINLTLLNESATIGKFANATEINVTIPGNLVFVLGTNRSGNFTNTHINFSNFSSTSSNITLSWRNASGIQNNVTNFSAFSFNVTGGSPGTYNISITIVNGSSSGATAAKGYTPLNISMVINDTTAPNISAVTGFGSNTNHSGTINFNFTLRDNVGNNSAQTNSLAALGKDHTGVASVNITIFNASARSDFNESNTETATTLISATNTTTAGYFNLTIDTSQFSDGVYNITIIVNDTNGNTNSTNFTNVRFDNTAPTAFHSCSPNPANNGDTITCTCTPEDATSLINTTQTSFVSNPSSTSNGNTTLTCSFEDNAGNSGSTTVELEVKNPSGGAGGGGGGGSGGFSYTSTISLENENFEDLGTINQLLSARQRVSLKIAGETHYVGIRELMTTSAKVEIFSEPVIVSLDIGEEVKVDVDDDNVYDVYVILNGIVNGKADLTITYIQDEIPQVEIGEGVETTGEIVEEEKEEPSSKGLNVMLIGLIVLIVIALVFWILKKRKVI